MNCFFQTKTIFVSHTPDDILLVWQTIFTFLVINCLFSNVVILNLPLIFFNTSLDITTWLICAVNSPKYLCFLVHTFPGVKINLGPLARSNVLVGFVPAHFAAICSILALQESFENLLQYVLVVRSHFGEFGSRGCSCSIFYTTEEVVTV